MFTGIIEAVSEVTEIKKSGSEVVISVTNKFSDDSEMKTGDSIAIDGTCLTATSITEKRITFFISKISYEKTLAKHYKSGTKVNLERALRYNGRLDGHIVTGHVDCLGEISKLKKIDKGYESEVKIPSNFSHLIVPRGSVAINGISLTLAEAGKNSFTFTIIPETLERTNLSDFIRKGGIVNLEFDILGKYVSRQLELKGGNKNSDYNSLLEKL